MAKRNLLDDNRAYNSALCNFIEIFAIHAKFTVSFENRYNEENRKQPSVQFRRRLSA
jgi:hypothetical protein